MADPHERFARYAARVDAYLDQHMPGPDMPPARLHRAMRYVVTGGGKRVRPLLCYGAAEALGVDAGLADPIAAALELVHAYSLVHDDLPAMDDDDMRRGRATVHVAYDEATAILVGDALQALAFELLAAPGSPIPGERAGGLLHALARACGSLGMAGGQAIDLQAVGTRMSLQELEGMHALKTGALIRAAVELPALAAGAGEGARAALVEYGESIGLAFQIQDDILDVEGETATLGKPRGSDEALNKPTFPALLGLEASHRKAGELLRRSLDALAALPGDTGLLRVLGRYIVERSY